MPPLSFIIFEVGVYVLGLICLYHAWRKGWYLALALVVTAAYSYLLEFMEIRLTTEYYYGCFLIMLCPGSDNCIPELACSGPTRCIPLAIPVTEAIIIYVAMQTSQRLGLPLFVGALLDGLLALTIDLNMDLIVSIGLRCDDVLPPSIEGGGVGFWIWKLTSDEIVFLGVPLNNFTGWFFAVVIFSLMLRIGWRWIPPGSKGIWGDLLVPILAIPATVIFMFVGYESLGRMNLPRMEWIEASIILGISALVVLRFAQSVKRDNAVDHVVLAVPLFFHLYFLAALFFADLYRAQPVLIMVWVLMFTLSMVSFSWPYWDRLISFKGTRS